jgi:hypothetical protein
MSRIRAARGRLVPCVARAQRSARIVRAGSRVADLPSPSFRSNVRPSWPCGQHSRPHRERAISGTDATQGVLSGGGERPWGQLSEEDSPRCLGEYVPAGHGRKGLWVGSGCVTVGVVTAWEHHAIPGRCRPRCRAVRGRVDPFATVSGSARALDGLSRREHFTGPGDRVFCTDVGGVLDDGPLRDRFYAALERAQLGHLARRTTRSSSTSCATRSAPSAPRSGRSTTCRATWATRTSRRR